MSPRVSPKRLGRSPLLEALVELRFEPATPTAGDLLPGLLYPAVKEWHADVTVTPLPDAALARAIRERSQELMYKPSHRLMGGSNALQLGNRVISVSTTEYLGWPQFKGMVESLLSNLRRTGFVKTPERFSLKYINVIPSTEAERQLALVDLRIEIAGGPPSDKGFMLRIERVDEGFVTIIQVAPNAIAKSSITAQEVHGLLIDLDTVRGALPNDFLNSPGELLEKAHAITKYNFFSLLTKSTLERLEPVW